MIWRGLFIRRRAQCAGFASHSWTKDSDGWAKGEGLRAGSREVTEQVPPAV